MNVLDFDIKKGIYKFEIDDLNSDHHSHPVVEIIMASNGFFSLESGNQKEENVAFAIIDSNTKHKVISENCTATLLMVEGYNELLSTFLNQLGIELNNGVFINKDNSQNSKLFKEIELFATRRDLKQIKDERIQKCLEILENDELEYDTMISTLRSKVFLSESRLSHLFKESIGISIKKYLVWSKLKKAIHLVLNEGVTLTEASLQSGFFDQAHLSNAFKNVLGITPSKAYNSRTLQF
ncbi:helix-turn-helix domain-containing protein [Aquimarina sp. 2304DJ70-9]|uniref:helix-turn-helix domain-containing protein n=1 Tax=Aquimarina penaris TaxID=3231044 RepID=UPI00346284CC